MVHHEIRLAAHDGRHAGPPETHQAEAREQAQEILSAANRQANDSIEHAKNQAREEGERIVNGAKAEIQQEVNRARDALKREVGALAIEGATQIIGREVNDEAHGDIIDKLAARI